MKKLAILLCLGLTLSSCAWAENTVKDLLPSCQQDAAITRVGLTAAKSLMLVYVSKPICGSPKAGQICSQIFIKRKLFAARDAANIAVTAFENSCDQTLFQVAKNAVDSFTQIVNVVTPPKAGKVDAPATPQ